MNIKIIACAAMSYSLMLLGGCVMGPDFKAPETSLGKH